MLRHHFAGIRKSRSGRKPPNPSGGLPDRIRASDVPAADQRNGLMSAITWPSIFGPGSDSIIT